MDRIRTYHHLASLGRRPSEYEISSSRLLWYRTHPFEVSTPIGQWYARHQTSSPLTCPDWDRFADPRETTYARYTALQQRQEIVVDALLERIERSGSDRTLSREALALLERILGPSRYALHGCQMIAAYAGSMAPSGRIAIVLLFQTADEMRRIERFAYRVRQLQIAHPGFAERSRDAWERDPAWQPLRATIERLLVTFDWAEAFTALNLCLKPLLDELLMTRFAAAAARAGDLRLPEILASLDEDCRWQREWSDALVGMIEEHGENRRILDGWIRRWRAEALTAVGALAPALGDVRAGGTELVTAGGGNEKGGEP